jgi:predicted dehydrogenase
MTNTPIRVGIIGVHPDKGWASIAHIPALQQLPEFRLTAISHHDPEIAKAAAEKFGVPHALGSTEELVTHPEVDLVVVAVKVTRHRDLVTQAIEAGKAVFSEWPLGMNLADATAMRDAARTRGVATTIGLQTRAVPAVAYMRDLIREGYVGEVLSATMIGSGITLGETMSDTFAYTLDPAKGVGLQNVVFAHSIDGLLSVLDSRFHTVAGTFATRRQQIRIEETGAMLPMTVPDQVVVIGTLDNGVVVTSHFRGGLSRGTNFHVEINGTKGDLILTSPVGYVGIGGFSLMGATGEETLHALEVPAHYGADCFMKGPSQSVAVAYARLASDMRQGTRLSPTFDDAVDLHHLIDAIEQSQGTPCHV